MKHKCQTDGFCCETYHNQSREAKLQGVLKNNVFEVRPSKAMVIVMLKNRHLRLVCRQNKASLFLLKLAASEGLLVIQILETTIAQRTITLLRGESVLDIEMVVYY